MRDLARRVKAYRLRDARGELFAEIALELSADPPSSGLGAVSYRVDIWRSDGVSESLARIDHRDAGIEVHFFGERRRWLESLERLDTLLAAMPTQIMRGDGIRDSHLAEIEQLIDWARLIREPTEDRLADVVSDIDALTAPRKVQALLTHRPESMRRVAVQTIDCATSFCTSPSISMEFTRFRGD
jgi:hypothetical protein